MLACVQTSQEGEHLRFESNWIPAASIPADAVTSCLRTTSNTLSFWMCELSEESIEEGVLALAADFSEVNPVHVVIFAWSELADLDLRRSPGNTKIARLVETHVDVENLSLHSQALVAARLANLVRNYREARCRSYPTGRVLSLLLRAVTRGDIRLEDLKPKLRKGVEQEKSKNLALEAARAAAAKGWGAQRVSVEIKKGAISVELLNEKGNPVGSLSYPLKGSRVKLNCKKGSRAAKIVEACRFAIESALKR